MEKPSDEDILRYEKQIKATEQSKPCLSIKMLTFDSIKPEYEQSEPVLKNKLENIIMQYGGWREVRRDGNCFYRAVGFALAELLQNDSVESSWKQFAVQNCRDFLKKLLLEVGYDLYAIEDFHEMFVETVVESGEKLLESFCTEYISDTVVCFLRLVTAAFLKKHRDMFEAFILDSYPGLNEFIASQVEPMNIEADNPQIVALVNALGVQIRVINLDASKTQSGSENYHEFSPFEAPSDLAFASIPCIYFLYRPGHYDLLYPK